MRLPYTPLPVLRLKTVSWKRYRLIFSFFLYFLATGWVIGILSPAFFAFFGFDEKNIFWLACALVSILGTVFSVFSWLNGKLVTSTLSFLSFFLTNRTLYFLGYSRKLQGGGQGRIGNDSFFVSQWTALDTDIIDIFLVQSFMAETLGARDDNTLLWGDFYYFFNNLNKFKRKGGIAGQQEIANLLKDIVEKGT